MPPPLKSGKTYSSSESDSEFSVPKIFKWYVLISAFHNLYMNDIGHTLQTWEVYVWWTDPAVSKYVWQIFNRFAGAFKRTQYLILEVWSLLPVSPPDVVDFVATTSVVELDFWEDFSSSSAIVKQLRVKSSSVSEISKKYH